MKKIAICFIITIFLSACKDKQSEFVIPDYKGWKKPVSEIIEIPIPGHGESYRIIYANNIAYNSRIEIINGVKRVNMKDGSVIVKEVYKKKNDVGRKTPGLFIMVKDNSSTEAVNGWIYYMKKPEENTVTVKWRLCVGCHEAANEKHPYFDGNRDEIFRDYLFVQIAK